MEALRTTPRDIEDKVEDSIIKSVRQTSLSELSIEGLGWLKEYWEDKYSEAFISRELAKRPEIEPILSKISGFRYAIQKELDSRIKLLFPDMP